MTAVDGRRERVVHDQGHAMGVGGGSEALDVEDRKRGVRDGLADDAFGSGPKGRIQLILTAEGRNEATLDAHLVQTVCEQVERAAVDRGACHQK